jgi:uncharacterized membrane-anchored protein
MRFRHWWLVGLVLAGFASTCTEAHAQVDGFIVGNSQTEVRAWRQGLKAMIGAPGKVDLAGQASLRLSGNLFFIPHDEAAEIIQTRHQPAIPDLVGIILDPDADNWFVVVRFIDGGFVHADDFQS